MHCENMLQIIHGFTSVLALSVAFHNKPSSFAISNRGRPKMDFTFSAVK